MKTATQQRAEKHNRRETQRLIAAVGYCRMSSDKQDTSIEKQQQEITAYAAKNGFKIMRWYIDEGITGDDESRVNFQRMVNDVQTVRDFEAVIVWNQKRFARFSVLKTAKYWDILQDAEIKLFTVDKGLISFDDIAGILMAVVEQNAGHEFLVDLACEISTVHRQIAENGFWPSSCPPLGYVSIPSPRDARFRSLAIDEATAPIVRRIFAEYLAGRGASEIARRLNADGVKTFRGNQFTELAVKDILKNEAYTGAIVFGKTATGKYWRNVGGERVRVKGAARKQKLAACHWSIVENTHEAIITRQEFRAVQAILKRRAGSRGGSVKKVTPLSGLCRCGHCGGRLMVTSRNTGQRIWRGLRCASGMKGRIPHDDCRCTVGLENVTEIIIRKVVEEYLGEPMLAHLQATISRILTAQRGQGAGRKQALTKSLAALDDKIARAEDKLLDEVPDYVEQALWRKIGELKTERQRVQAELTATGRMGELSERVIAAQCRALVERLRTIREHITTGDAAAVRAGLEEITERITLWSAPITQRRPGMGANAKRALHRIHIAYRNPICVLEGLSSCTIEIANCIPELKRAIADKIVGS